MLPLLMGVGLALGAVGTGISIFGSRQADRAQQQLTEAQRRAEAIRHQAMVLDATRRRREIVRQGVIARSMALATTTNQGASAGSGLLGAYGQIAGREGTGLTGVSQQLDAGENMFQANLAALSARRNQAQAQSTMAIGSSIAGLGASVLGNMGSINNIFGGGGGGNSGGGYSGGTSYGETINGIGSNGIY